MRRPAAATALTAHHRMARRLMGALAVFAALSGCAEPEQRLIGQRFSIDVPLADSLPAETGERVQITEPENRAAPIRLPAPERNANWAHRGGTAAHLMPHVALAGDPQVLWTASIGAGDRRDQRITASPVVSDGRVFAMDADGNINALALADGAVLWRSAAQGAGRGTTAPAGGGLALAGGRLFVTTTAGDLLALDAATGAEVWRKRFDTPLAGSPTALGGTVFVQGRDATGWAVNAADGRLRWVVPGQPQVAAVAASAAPAASGGRVVFALPGAVLTAADAATGASLWTSSVPGVRPGLATALVRDVTGDPVLWRDQIIAGSSAGRTAALSAEDGRVLWTADAGAMGPVWPVADALFLVSDRNQLVRLDAASGQTVWSVPLPGYLREGENRGPMHAHHGPVLAGGRLIVASSDGLVRLFDPADGGQIGQIAVVGGAASLPVVADGTLIVVSRRGEVHAFR